MASTSNRSCEGSSSKPCSTDEQPLITVLTAVRNGEKSLAECIESVLAQDYPNIEHIILDGASTDGTLQILRNYDQKLALWISEPDRGVYDAWNKGLNLAKGEWIAFLGADDKYLPGAISAYLELAKVEPSAEYLSSRMRWMYSSTYSRIQGERWEWPLYSRVMCAPHVGSLHRRSLFARYGQYDLSYRITADYEFLLRPRNSLRAAFLPQVTVVMKAGGLSESIAALREACRARISTGGRPWWVASIELYIGIIKFKLRPLRRMLARQDLRKRAWPTSF